MEKGTNNVMPVAFEAGDLFATPDVVAFAHGCNCAGAMGKGIAVAFKKRWPAMYDEYRRRCKANEFELGDVFAWVDGKYTVFNLGTQRTWRTKAELGAIKKALGEMIRIAEEKQIEQIALPRIGAGLGGVEWADVKQAIITIASQTDVLLRVCETFVEGQTLQSAE